jgi:hypothetical protein
VKIAAKIRCSQLLKPCNGYLSNPNASTLLNTVKTSQNPGLIVL